MTAFGHPTTDPGDGRIRCDACGKYVWLVVHSCKGGAVTYAQKAGGPRSSTNPLPDVDLLAILGDDDMSEDPPAPAVTRDELAILAEEVLFEHRERRDGMQPADGNSRCACGHSTGQQPGPGRPGGRQPGHHLMDFHRAQVLADELARYDIRLRPTEGSDTNAD